MAHPIENTLALLQDAMVAHREALARSPSLAPPPDMALPRDRRAQLILRLLVGVERRAGIEVSQSTAEKLLRILAGLDIIELEAWVLRLERLPAGDAEWLSLIESLTVHETYVMRDPSQLQFFAGQLPGLIATAAASQSFSLRFWSVGCATGEEAYSIAALTLDAMIAAGHAVATDTGAALLPPWRIEVLGSDISRLVLTQARAGLYDTGPLSSFRTESASLLRHFPESPVAGSSGYAARAASADLKALVSFEHFNIVEDSAPTGAFNAVFCRNVLIYFSLRARQRAQESLRRAVRKGGYLLLGPTDTLLDPTAFETLWAPGAVIYRRSKDDD